MFRRRALALAACAALPLGAAVGLAPAAGAQAGAEIINQTVDVTYSCIAANASNIGGNAPFTNSVSVSYPETVAPGEVFEVTLQPGSMQPVQARTGRVTYDIQLPTNAYVVSSALAGGESGFNSGTPAIAKINATSKATDAAGTALRIWGGASARYGSSTGTSTNAGLQKTSNAAFRLPAVKITMRAPLTPGEDIVVGLPGAGAASANNGANTQFAYTRGTNNTGTYVDCAVSQNAASLITVPVTDSAPVTIDSTTNVVGGDQTADSSIPVNLTAQVTAQNVSPSDISQGTVTFRDQETNLVVGTANPNASGMATVTHQFPRIPDGDPDQVRTVIAEYSGVAGNVNPSSDTIQLTLTEKPTVFYNTTFTVAARVGTLTDTAQPVSVTATFARPATNFPATAQVQLYRDGEAVGAPVTMPASGTTVTLTDEVPRSELATVHHYTVELVTIWEDYKEWKGSTATPSPVVVRGLNGETITPPPAPGSLDLSGITNPITGSLSDLVGHDVAPLSSPTVTGMLSSAS